MLSAQELRELKLYSNNIAAELHGLERWVHLAPKCLLGPAYPTPSPPLPLPLIPG